MFDILVIGSGPAGVSAALTLSAAGRSVAMASIMSSYLTDTTLATDYYGLEGFTGEEIYLKGVRQAKHAGVVFFNQQITGLSRQGNQFIAAGQTPLEAACVLLATGTPVDHSLPDYGLPFAQKGVHLQAEQDGFYYRNRMVGVVGAGCYGVHQAMLLSRIARTVTLFTNDQRIPSVPPPIGLNRYPIDRLEGQDRLEKIVFENGTALNLDGLFIANRIADAVDLCVGVGAQTNDHYPILDPQGMTSVAGLFAAGDCTGNTHTLQEQTYDGYRVAKNILSFFAK